MGSGRGPGMSLPTQQPDRDDIGYRCGLVQNGTYVQPVEVHIGVSDGSRRRFQAGVEQV